MTEMQQRSTFVTAVAWVFIGLSGFLTIISILQNVMVQIVFRDVEMDQIPPDAPFMANHFQLFFLAFLLVSAFVLISSIGLLRRCNWARLCFVGIMLFGILWNLGGLVVQFIMFSSMRGQFGEFAAQGAPDMQSFFIAIMVGSGLFAVGFSVLFGWIAKRLMSAPIVAEFRR
ncbi:MAG: hypothetical protein LBP90_01760 [Burkholderiales bacterium]|nr:hypothetical protein [Burkholderiales bacterium]